MPLFAIALSGCELPTAADLIPGSTEDDAIRKTLVAAYVDLRPGECEELHTIHYLMQTEAPDPDAALAECDREAEPGKFAESLEVADVSVDGTTAEATFTITGGCADGMTLKVQLINSSGWKLNQILEVEVDRARLEATQRDAAVEQGFAPADADCIVRRMRREYSTRELEQSVLHAGQHDPMGEGAAPEMLAACVGEETLESSIKEMRAQAAGSAPAELIDCMADRMEAAAQTRDGRLELVQGELGQKIGTGCRLELEAGLLEGHPAS